MDAGYPAKLVDKAVNETQELQPLALKVGRLGGTARWGVSRARVKSGGRGREGARNTPTLTILFLENMSSYDRPAFQNDDGRCTSFCIRANSMLVSNSMLPLFFAPCEG